MTNLATMYDDTFYDAAMSNSYKSGQTFAEHLSHIFKLDTVVDVGCGRGAWLRAFKERGADTLVGFDGVWNKQENMVADYIEFKAVDLNKPLEYKPGYKFDLAMSLEVAEHLEESSAPIFIKSLTDLSDVIMFGAAFIGQDGVNHINLQPHTYWAKHFQVLGYVPFDIFRAPYWGDDRVDYCYRQNTFLYVRDGSPAYQTITAMNIKPVEFIPFMDCVHPYIYSLYVNETLHLREENNYLKNHRVSKLGLREHFQMTVKAFIDAIKRRLGLID